MLKSLYKSVVLCTIAVGCFLFSASNVYAQKMEAISAQSAHEYAKEHLSSSDMEYFKGGKDTVICGNKELLCDKATQACIKCRLHYKEMLLSKVQVAQKVIEEGRCINANSIDEENLEASLKTIWPECKTTYGYDGFGNEYIYTRTLSIEPNGFLREIGSKAFGISYNREKYELDGTDGKKYFLYMDGGNPVLSYGSNDFKGCEVLPVKLFNMKSCFFCPAAQVIFAAANNATRESFDSFAHSFIILIVVVYAVWLALTSLQQVFPFTKKDAADYIEIILKQTLKFAIAYYLLINSATLFKMFVSPVLQSGMVMGEKIQLQEVKSIKEAKNIDVPEVKLGSDYYNIKSSTGKTLFVQIERYLSVIQGQMAYMQAIGTSLFCVGTRQMFNWPWKEEFIDGLRMTFLGSFFCVIGFLLSIAFAYYFLDAILQLGLLGVLMPLMIAGWPFKITSNYAKKGLEFLLNTFFVFFFTGFVVSVNMVLIDNALSMSNEATEIGLTDDDISGFGAIATAINEQNITDLDKATSIGTVGFLLLFFAAFFGFKFVQQVQPLANKLSGGAISGMASNIATMGYSTAKSAASKVAAPIGNAISEKWNEGGGVGGRLMGGAQKLVSGTGKAVTATLGKTKVGQKIARGLNKASQGIGRARQAYTASRMSNKKR